MNHVIQCKHPLLLASQSPRRVMLLTNAGVRFRQHAPDESAEDARRNGESVAAYVARMAFQKFENVRSLTQPDELVLACDTVAECHGEVLGKPRDRRHAKEMLTTMRGQVHQVVSGVCLSHASGKPCYLKNEITTLVMDDISDAALEAYLDTDGWKGKAGAFGFQDGLDWVRIVEGSESNVVGLPMELLRVMLECWPTDAPDSANHSPLQ